MSRGGTGRVVSGLVAGAVVLASGGAGPAAAEASGVGEYVALGDSWAADATLSQVSARFVPVGCAQSAGNYPKQVAAALGPARFVDATCGGATTANLTEPQSLPVGADNPPQFDRLGPGTDLVTLEIGGNDIGLASAVSECVTGDPGTAVCRDTYVRDGVDAMTQRIAAAAPKISAAIDGIRARAPRARILLVDYLAGIGTTGGCFPVIPISDADASWLGNKLLELDRMLAEVARAQKVEFVDTYAGSGGHDACQAPGVRWVEGLIPLSVNPVGPAVPFHPNQLGADHQARTVLAALRR
ncbi:SGNH/GDSL hydrolase family protein [Nocardia panacis]|uniref:SGNH/GDSL hydrolase family protein n=1 Tax=Nocardia panacis TaxID=2340916 RepID=UPI0013153B80|nr:SGNH/GDSL hydrolase family protein [Nocardia panacis]